MAKRICENNSYRRSRYDPTKTPIRLLLACVTGAPSSSTQSYPSGAASSLGPKQQDIDRLLQHESDAL
jgi:hypothetical protein